MTCLAGWLLACSLWIRTAVTVFALPHLALAAGPLYVGVALDMIGLSEGMMPGQNSQTMLDNLVWVLAVGVILL